MSSVACHTSDEIFTDP